MNVTKTSLLASVDIFNEQSLLSEVLLSLKVSKNSILRISNNGQNKGNHYSTHRYDHFSLQYGGILHEESMVVVEDEASFYDVLCKEASQWDKEWRLILIKRFAFLSVCRQIINHRPTLWKFLVVHCPYDVSKIVAHTNYKEK